MMRSLYSAVSGLKGHQTRMDVIGNNIANVNTTGFKSSRVNFEDMISQTLSGASSSTDSLGGTNPKQVGLGVSVGSIDTLFTDGTTQSTGKNTDLALSGNGLFVVKNGNETYYTRDGAFQFDANGNYVLPSSGLKVQGWNATNGSLNTSGAVEDIVVSSGKSMASEATKIVTYANNLNAAATTITSMSGGDKELMLSDGTTLVDSNNKYSVGDVYSTTTTSTSGTVVTIDSTASASGTDHSSNVPVTVTLAGSVNGSSTATPSTVTSEWTYGYTLSSAGASATADSNNPVTIKDTSGNTIATVTSGTYSVGGTYTGASVTTTGSRVTASSSDPIELQLADGTTHTVYSDTYVVGTDTYTYTNSADNTKHTSTVTGYAPQYTIGSMDVKTTGGDGASVMVGGKAYYTTSTSGAQLTASSDAPVTLTLANGKTYDVTSSTYTVGSDYETPEETSGTSEKSSSTNIVVLHLADGSTVEDRTTGGQYTVGDNYTYTKDGTPATTQISGFSYKSAIASMEQSSTISSVATSTTVLGAAGSTATTASTDHPVILTMSDGSTVTETSGTYVTGHSLPVTTMVTVYDTLGNSHAVPIYFTKSSTDSTNGNSWTVSVNSDGTGTSTINEDDGTTTTVAMADATINFTTSGKFKSGSPQTVTMTLTNGSKGTQTVTLNLQDLTQYAGNSTINGTADGHAAGTLSSVAIDKSGLITGTYTNGVKQTEAQVAIAQFTNAAGLEKTGSSLYQVSNNSGTPNVKTASDLGVTITPSALEMSNVDISDEFTNMIVTQRGFQSNSKIITVDDELLETVINMKR